MTAPAACVLVVDDDRDIRETVQEVLEMQGYSVATAPDGIEALEYLRRTSPPEVILLDLSMPVMDGAAFRAQQLADPGLAAIPVIAFSATATISEKIRDLGVAAYLRKPVQLQDLVAAVRRFCAPG
jgi:CheY-like chemotaxis protein